MADGLTGKVLIIKAIIKMGEDMDMVSTIMKNLRKLASLTMILTLLNCLVFINK
jgi:hypothetical protein